MTKLNSLLGTVALSATLLGGLQASADVQSDYAARFEPVLKSVTSLELPAKAASLVSVTRAGQKQAAALAIIQVVSKINPSALSTVVGAISRTEPTLAPAVAASAIKLQPKLASDIKVATVSATSPTLTSVPIPPVPSDSSGKQKGHYKGTPDGPPGQFP